MKTIRKDDSIKKVADRVAAEEVKHGWTYCAKHFWKERKNKTPIETVAEVVQATEVSEATEVPIDDVKTKKPHRKSYKDKMRESRRKSKAEKVAAKEDSEKVA